MSKELKENITHDYKNLYSTRTIIFVGTFYEVLRKETKETQLC